MPDHDLSGLEAALQRSSYLETALLNLHYFRLRHTEELTPKQQEFLKTAMHTTACLLNDMLGGVD